MIYRGKIFRKASENGIWETVAPRRNPGREDEWLVGKLGSTMTMPVSARELEDGDQWIPVRDY